MDCLLFVCLLARLFTCPGVFVCLLDYLLACVCVCGGCLLVCLFVCLSDFFVACVCVRVLLCLCGCLLVFLFI